MYTYGSKGGYSGLGYMWGEAKTDSPATTIAQVKAIANGKATINPVKEIEQELPASVVVDDLEATVINPSDFIPKPKKIVNAFEAEQVLRRPYGMKGGKGKKTKGKVYWTASGPQFSQKPVLAGKTAEKVDPPSIKLKPNIKVVRDLPTVSGLAPIEVPAAKTTALQGFGDQVVNKFNLILVLGLLIYLFNRK